ncbi:MAG: c-type cytochrome [Flavisolibacter sp.]|jgi:hypothetical protein|nr:c-type cytochrome [Flavisolibacter sp.]
MNKSFLVTLGIVLIVAASMAFTSGQDPHYKNLKVLPKNITKHQLDSVMKHFTTALNVKCNFCHVKVEGSDEWNFPSDVNKHKLIARDMMKMTNNINKKYFDVTGSGGKKDLNVQLMVTCYTCHNGRKEPLAFVPVKDTARK